MSDILCGNSLSNGKKSKRRKNHIAKNRDQNESVPVDSTSQQSTSADKEEGKVELKSAVKTVPENKTSNEQKEQPEENSAVEKLNTSLDNDADKGDKNKLDVVEGTTNNLPKKKKRNKKNKKKNNENNEEVAVKETKNVENKDVKSYISYADKVTNGKPVNLKSGAAVTHCILRVDVPLKRGSKNEEKKSSSYKSYPKFNKGKRNDAFGKKYSMGKDYFKKEKFSTFNQKKERTLNSVEKKGKSSYFYENKEKISNSDEKTKKISNSHEKREEISNFDNVDNVDDQVDHMVCDNHKYGSFLNAQIIQNNQISDKDDIIDENRKYEESYISSMNKDTNSIIQERTNIIKISPNDTLYYETDNIKTVSPKLKHNKRTFYRSNSGSVKKIKNENDQKEIKEFKEKEETKDNEEEEKNGKITQSIFDIIYNHYVNDINQNIVKPNESYSRKGSNESNNINNNNNNNNNNKGMNLDLFLYITKQYKILKNLLTKGELEQIFIKESKGNTSIQSKTFKKVLMICAQKGFSKPPHNINFTDNKKIYTTLIQWLLNHSPENQKQLILKRSDITNMNFSNDSHKTIDFKKANVRTLSDSKYGSFKNKQHSSIFMKKEK
ncbi:hypothetical protein PFTANZ_05665 [Plasmodium falciparum Tanzania (2000708)]|uniref:Uncharacterized protein n=1 Tax=Plasmodium falciparum Tanzania (2000708) TaxID=1036725 RepID=A0A024VY58_PLAFA|nr:hypothetical protein PFTANZ_05665 [Plasmodium falciparum Tanzania (2000708)]